MAYNEESVEDVDFKEIYDELDEEDKKELKEIRNELEKYERNVDSVIKDKKLKKRVAKLCLKLIDKTIGDKTAVMKICYFITGHFTMFDFGDELNKAIGIAGELELPEQHVSGDVLELWEKMRKIFLNYILDN